MYLLLVMVALYQRMDEIRAQEEGLPISEVARGRPGRVVVKERARRGDAS